MAGGLFSTVTASILIAAAPAAAQTYTPSSAPMSQTSAPMPQMYSQPAPAAAAASVASPLPPKATDETLALDNASTVAVSIDPFFFRVSG